MKPKLYIPAFDPASHCYTLPDGTVLDSVTTILNLECPASYYGDGLTQAQERGIAVHLGCQYMDQKDDLIFEKIMPHLASIRPYLEQYEDALSKCQIKVLKNEVSRYNPWYFYAGTFDKMVTVAGKPGIIDIKTGSERITHKWQLAAYVELIKHEHPGVNLARWNLYLQPGKFKLIPRIGENDFKEFLCLCSAHNLKLKYGIRKRETQEDK